MTRRRAAPLHPAGDRRNERSFLKKKFPGGLHPPYFNFDYKNTFITSIELLNDQMIQMIKYSKDLLMIV